MENTAIWVRRGTKVHGPFTLDQVKSSIKSGKILSTDELAKSELGPWKAVADSVRPSSASSSSATPGYSIASSPTPALPINPHAPPIRNDGVAPPQRMVVHQLDTMQFLVEGATMPAVFQTLKTAAARSHNVTGAFSKSGLIRGTGSSGIEFVVKVENAEEGVSFSVDGSTPDGPANFGVLFNPMSVEGWATAGAVGLFNSLVNNSAARTVSGDVSLLLINLLDSLGAADLVTGGAGETVDVGAIQQRIDALPHISISPIEHNRLTTNYPADALLPLVLRLLKAQEMANPRGLAGKLGLNVTGRYDIVENVAMTPDGNGITANMPDGKTIHKFTLTVGARPLDATSSEVMVDVKCSMPKALDIGGFFGRHCKKQMTFIRDAIVQELRSKMGG